MRFLFTAAPEVGHLVPLFGIGRALRAAGHDVLLATHPGRHGMVAAAGFAAATAGMSGEEANLERRRRWPESDLQPPTTWGVRMFTQILAPSMLDDLRRLVKEWRPTLVIHEEGEYAGPVVAAEAGIPWVTHGWGSPLRPEGELRSLESGAAQLWSGAGVDVPEGAGLYRYGLIDPCPPSLEGAGTSPLPRWPVRPSMLGRSLPAPATGDGGRSNSVPISKATASPATHSPLLSPLREGAAGERAICYVGFGTVRQFANAPTEMVAAVEGALAGGLRVVVTTSDTSLAEAVTALAPRLVEVREFVDLADLLPRCRLVVNHGGAGTTLAALSNGVPLVVVPQGAPSQERMASAVARAGLGLVAKASGADATAVVDAVTIATTDEGVLERARALQDEILAMPAPEVVVPELEALVGSWLSG